MLTLSVGAVACTDFFITRGASADGSQIVAMSTDADGVYDPRLVYIAPRTFPAGSMRPVYPLMNYPRASDCRRSPTYCEQLPANFTPYAPLGYIPQVESTYGYWEHDYAVANDVGLAISESTASSKVATWPVPQGNALLSISELTQLAMERCASAECAVRTMGAAAEKYGFYGDASYNIAAEMLIIADAGGAAWMFHVMPANETSGGAIWVAQPIPDGHIATLANAFVIGDTSKNGVVLSHNAQEIAQRNGWWNPADGPLHFARTFSWGEYTSKYYSGRRMWRFWNVFAPSLNLSAEYDEYLKDMPYPVSAPPDAPVTLQAVRRLYRDTYTNTKYDAAQPSSGSGPFGNPIRWNTDQNPQDGQTVPGAWERTIAMSRTECSSIVHHPKSSTGRGALWYTPHSPHGGVYHIVPIGGGAAGAPRQLSTGSPLEFDTTSAFWRARLLGNLMWGPSYSRYAADVFAAQDALETLAEPMVASWAAGGAPWDADALSQHFVDAWNTLLGTTLVKNADGYVFDPITQNVGEPGYPSWFLEASDYVQRTRIIDPPNVPQPNNHSAIAKAPRAGRRRF